jgi:hypothetical protein
MVSFMCDYSLYSVPNRLAMDGEELVVHRFQTGSLGLASVVDVARHECTRREASKGSVWHRIKCYFQDPMDRVPVPAVCIPPGTQIILKGIPGSTQQTYGLQKEEGAIFVQTSAEGNTYRDALRFYNGAQVRLQDLRIGQLVEVLSLAGSSEQPLLRELQMQ